MAKIEAAIRDAILRGARRQIRLVAVPLRREARRLRQAVLQLRRDVSALRAVAAQWRRAIRTTRWTPDVSEDEVRIARLSPGLVRKLRERLGLSQAELSRLVGVSAGAVVQWEAGRSAPAGRNRRALIALRKVGRRDVKLALATMANPSANGKSRARRKRRPTRVGAKPRK
ncbi:MAG: helix-turn-helix domain-containing protein [Candidatus Rokuibacteriota bacterium]